MRQAGTVIGVNKADAGRAISALPEIISGTLSRTG